MITITEKAQQKIAKLEEQLHQPVKGLRVRATPRSKMRAFFNMSLVPRAEAVPPADLVEKVGEIAVYIDPDSAPYLDGAAIDYILTPMACGFKVIAPPRKLDTPEGELAARIQNVLEGQVNRNLMLHGGGTTLVDVQGDVAYLEMTGGCQGCAQAGATLRNEIWAVIKKEIPEIREVRDVTQHEAGPNPYFPG